MKLISDVVGYNSERWYTGEIRDVAEADALNFRNSRIAIILKDTDYQEFTVEELRNKCDEEDIKISLETTKVEMVFYLGLFDFYNEKELAELLDLLVKRKLFFKDMWAKKELINILIAYDELYEALKDNYEIANINDTITYLIYDQLDKNQILNVCDFLHINHMAEFEDKADLINKILEHFEWV